MSCCGIDLVLQNRGAAKKPSALDRRRMLVERAKGNAKVRATNRVEKMRGIQSSTPKQTNTPRQRNNIQKSDISISVQNNWMAQEKVRYDHRCHSAERINICREKERRKKLQKYKQTTSTSSPTPTKKVANNNNSSDLKIRVSK
jgi:hypothetical protein